MSSEISCGIFPEISGKITVLFRNNSAKNFPEVCGRKFHEILMQLQHSIALIAFMRWCLLTKFTCLLTLCTLSRQTHIAGKQTSSVNDVIHYECMIDRILHVRKISGIFPEKFRKVSDILFFRKTYNPSWDYQKTGTFLVEKCNAANGMKNCHRRVVGTIWEWGDGSLGDKSPRGFRDFAPVRGLGTVSKKADRFFGVSLNTASDYRPLSDYRPTVVLLDV